MRFSKVKLGIAMSRKGYNFLTLAEASGVSRTTLSYINNGKTCRPDIASKIANALEVDITELLED